MYNKFLIEENHIENKEVNKLSYRKQGCMDHVFIKKAHGDGSEQQK